MPAVVAYKMDPPRFGVGEKKNERLAFPRIFSAVSLEELMTGEYDC
jgi:hypothetical protein